MMIETLAIVCPHVFRIQRDVSLVIHHSDGTWQFVCGLHDHDPQCADFETVGLRHLTNRQSNLVELNTLPAGCLAEWINGEWRIVRHDD